MFPESEHGKSRYRGIPGKGIDDQGLSRIELQGGRLHRTHSRPPEKFVDDRGTLTACVVNEGLDTLDTILLGNVPADVRRAERLCSDGSWREVGFSGNELESPLAAMDIAFFRFA